jgi:hypothetical protein
VKAEGLISCDTIANISRQSSLEIKIEYVHFIKADHYIGFYKLIILWWQQGSNYSTYIVGTFGLLEIVLLLASP